VLADSKGALILRPREKLPTKPAIKESVFLRHLKDSDVENFVPHMYRDDNGNVTVGIGQLLRTANDAKQLTFTRRGTNVKASAREIELDFNNVKSAPVSSKSKAPVYQQFTKLEFTEPRAEALALDRMREFLGFLRRTYFPEFDTYPVLVKMGLLDLAYNAGARGARDNYKDFAAAMDRRNWKWAGVKQRRDRPVGRANIVQAWFNQAAQQGPFFISHTNCQKTLASIAK
jgi:GH24 family phage-related lysozyme (muramidase)